MSNMNTEKSNPFILFVALLFIGYIVVWVFTSNYHHGKFEAKSVPEMEKSTQAEVIEVVNEFSLDKPTSKSLAAGKKTFTLNCASCHGENGDGQGPAGTALVPPARNFKNLSEWKFGYEPANIVNTLNNGSPGTSMAPYAWLSEDEKTSLAHYVRSFMPIDAKSSSSTEMTSAATTTQSTMTAEPSFDVADVKIDNKKIAESLLKRSIETEKAKMLKPMSKIDRLKMIYMTSLKRVKVAPYSTVLINTKDYNLKNTLADYNTFKSFVTSDAMFGLTGESFQTLNDDELRSIYQQLN